MKISEYTSKCREFITMKDKATLHDYLDFGLIEEVGEVAGKFAKAIRAQGGPILNEKDRESIAKELGDVCWFTVVSFSESHYSEFADHAKIGQFDDKIGIKSLVQKMADLSVAYSTPISPGAFYDLLCCVKTLGERIGYTLDEILQMNIDKLTDRAARGVINGSGDNR